MKSELTELDFIEKRQQVITKSLEEFYQKFQQTRKPNNLMFQIKHFKVCCMCRRRKF